MIWTSCVVRMFEDCVGHVGLIEHFGFRVCLRKKGQAKFVAANRFTLLDIGSVLVR